MTIGFKAGLLIAAKHAVNAAFTTAIPTAIWPTFFQGHTLIGLAHIGGLLGSSILAREASVWLPKVLKWSMTGLGSKE